MAIFNYAAREMTAKIVYYGPGLSGKTTSIQYIHGKISPKSKGKLVSLATETDRTLFFDFFPLEFGQVGGFRVKFNFYTVPGQVFYNTTRKLVLKGADGVVFVADSQPGMMDQNVESFQNLKENLKAHGIDSETVPFVVQYNKRDLPGAVPVEELRRTLNPRGVPEFETVANTGAGIMDAMKAVCRMVLEDIQRKQRSAAPKAGQPRAQAPSGQAVPAPETSRPPAPAEPVQPPPRASGVERSLTIPVKGPGERQVVLRVPLELELEGDVECVEVTAEVRVAYRGGQGRVRIRELSLQPAEEPPKAKGLLGRFFGSK